MAFMDDDSRYLVSYGLYASQSAALGAGGAAGRHRGVGSAAGKMWRETVEAIFLTPV
jgi:hypothetical protein